MENKNCPPCSSCHYYLVCDIAAIGGPEGCDRFAEWLRKQKEYSKKGKEG